MPSGPWLIALFLLAIPMTALLWYPIKRTSAHLEVSYNEGWNSYQSRMALRGIPLYGSPPKFTIMNYPPLSFHIIGFIGRFASNLTAVGRWASVASIAGIALLIGALVRRFTSDWRAGAYAAMSYVIWLGVYTPDRIGMNDPHLLGALFSTLGLYLYVRQPQSTTSLGWSAVVFSIGFFIKHNLIGLPAAVGAHLLLTSPRRFAVWAAMLAAAVAACVLFAVGVDGTYFWSHLLVPRFYSFHSAWFNIAWYLIVFQIPLATAIVWSLYNATSASRSVLVIAAVFANMLALVFSGGDGVYRNVFFDSIILLAIISAITLSDLAGALDKKRLSGITFTLLLLLPFAGALAVLPQELSAAWTARQKIPHLEKEFAGAVEFLRNRPGPALCENLLLCYEAGKPFLYDSFFVDDHVRLGRIRQAEVLGMIETLQFRTIEIELRAGQPLAPAARARFSEAFMRTLLDHYRQVGRTYDASPQVVESAGFEGQDPRFAFLVPKNED
jgi:hypothetical protein